MNRSANFNKVHPSQGTAICSREQAIQVADYDHHQVVVNGKSAILLTDEWLPLEEHRGPFVLTVVFHGTDQHPPAPGHVQSIVDELKFQLRSQPR